MNNQNRSFFFNVDWLTIILFLCLLAIGWFNINAAVYNDDQPLFTLASNSGKQLIFIIVAIVVGIVILLLDSKFFYTFSPIFYGITILLLMAVLVVGRNVGGNQAWIPIGSFRLQPSEFAKWATSLLLARQLSTMNSKISDLKTVIPTLAILSFPVLLIILQPDAGSALVFTSLIFVLYREGLPTYYLIAGLMMVILFIFTLLYSKLFVIVALLILLSLLIYSFRKNQKIIVSFVIGFVLSTLFVFSVDFVYKNILKPHQKVRIDLILGIVKDPRGAGYNVNQSKIAIGSGGLTGKGYLQGTQTKFNFVPEQSTDFIFCTIGEEWGFVGSVVVVGLYLFLLLRIIFLAERQRSTFNRVYGYAVACIIFCHFFVNIAMTIGLMPVIGIPLPFISYGGSSLVSFTILLFILIKLDSTRMGVV
ncbi:MAG: rod shape-determining protein RodA [Bacteroidetes bacterium]|nr:rod shape-determining protein RodA [Bacteroidota bacterium]MBU1373329.1 rod shape-determining protein RodA [Bacteroidota bacterium]MBU1484420.1 rod shape-determining protein RodA [Bacteroidota bacterium]MBU1762214.1 rod shape-determining protein RodA [Bacteroidota bacterium]MBU2046995.1 rod shape-determining protein RodA [Bacteroidota bacterium]